MTTWNNKDYCAPDSTLWTGRSDTLPNERIFNSITCIDLTKTDLTTLPLNSSHTHLGVIGFCCDEGIKRNQGRLGAQQGPIVLRQTLANLSTASFSEKIQLWDFGNIECAHQDLEASQHSLGELVQLLISHKIIPIVLGGGHETAWGHYQGIAKTNFTSKLGIINLDAHFDMRELLPDQKGSSGTPFLQIALARQQASLPFDYYCLGIQTLGNTKSLFETAEKWRVGYVTADAIHNPQKAEDHTKALTSFLKQHDNIYLSICLDVFAAAFAPGVSAPQANGITPWEGIALLQKIITSNKVRSIDIVELSPSNDINQMTAKLGAGLIGQICQMWPE